MWKNDDPGSPQSLFRMLGQIDLNVGNVFEQFKFGFDDSDEVSLGGINISNIRTTMLCISWREWKQGINIISEVKFLLNYSRFFYQAKIIFLWFQRVKCEDLRTQ